MLPHLFRLFRPNRNSYAMCYSKPPAPVLLKVWQEKVWTLCVRLIVFLNDLERHSIISIIWWWCAVVQQVLKLPGLSLVLRHLRLHLALVQCQTCVRSTTTVCTTFILLFICIFLLNIVYLAFYFYFILSWLTQDLSTNFVLLINGMTNKVP